MSEATEYPRPTLQEEAERLLSYWEQHGNNLDAVVRWAVDDLLGLARALVGLIWKLDHTFHKGS